MLYSSRCEYAIRALTHLAGRTPGERVRAADVADAEGIPAPMLGKVMRQLAQGGLLSSSRGPKGGYALRYSPDEVSLLEIREAIDGTDDLERCAVGLDPCDDETACPLHDTFKPLREAIRGYLETTTLRDLSRGLWRKEALLAQRVLTATNPLPPRERAAGE